MHAKSCTKSTVSMISTIYPWNISKLIVLINLFLINSIKAYSSQLLSRDKKRNFRGHDSVISESYRSFLIANWIFSFITISGFDNNYKFFSVRSKAEVFVAYKINSGIYRNVCVCVCVCVFSFALVFFKDSKKWKPLHIFGNIQSNHEIVSTLYYGFYDITIYQVDYENKN